MVAENKIALSRVSHVYIGKKDKCMCGCAGKYSYSESHRDWASKNRGYEVKQEEIDFGMIDKVVKKLNQHLAKVKFENNFAYIEGKNKILVVYFGQQSEPEFQI